MDVWFLVNVNDMFQNLLHKLNIDNGPGTSGPGAICAREPRVHELYHPPPWCPPSLGEIGSNQTGLAWPPHCHCHLPATTLVEDRLAVTTVKCYWLGGWGGKRGGVNGAIHYSLLRKHIVVYFCTIQFTNVFFAEKTTRCHTQGLAQGSGAIQSLSIA